MCLPLPYLLTPRHTASMTYSTAACTTDTQTLPPIVSLQLLALNFFDLKSLVPPFSHPLTFLKHTLVSFAQCHSPPVMLVFSCLSLFCQLHSPGWPSPKLSLRFLNRPSWTISRSLIFSCFVPYHLPVRFVILFHYHFESPWTGKVFDLIT